MGRKNWNESVQLKGPGRKSRKQGDPELPSKLQDKDIKKVKSGLGGRIKQRARKRTVKLATAKDLKVEAKKTKPKGAVVDYTEVPPPKDTPAVSKESSGKKSILSKASSGKKSSSKHVKINLFTGDSGGKE